MPLHCPMSVLTAGMIGTLSCGMRHSARGKKGGIGQPMTKVRQRASLPVDAVKLALEREHQKREDIKPIELLKVACPPILPSRSTRTKRTQRRRPRRLSSQRTAPPFAAEPRRPSTGCSSTLITGVPPTNRAFSKPASGQRTPGSACKPFRCGRPTPSS